jgi:hypothetical protein
MTTALARQQQALLPDAATLQTMLTMAEQLVASGLLPQSIKTPAAALAVIQKGVELGIPPMYALSNIGIINGRPVVGAEVLLAMVYRDHGDSAIIVEETSAERCTVTYRRKGWDKARQFSWTTQDAEQAGLLGKGGPWKQYPAAMLRARCISAVARLAFADSIGGMYLPEELGAEVEVVDGEIVVVDQKPAPTPLRTVKPSEVVEPTDEENERARAMVRGGEVGASTAATEAKTTARAKLEASLKRGIEKARSLKLEVADLEAEKLSDQEIKDALGALAEMVKAAESGADAF